MLGKHTPTLGSLKSWAEAIEVWVIGAAPLRRPDIARAWGIDARESPLNEAGAKAEQASRPANMASGTIERRSMLLYR